jgi:hypothetical protein
MDFFIFLKKARIHWPKFLVFLIISLFIKSSDSRGCEIIDQEALAWTEERLRRVTGLSLENQLQIPSCFQVSIIDEGFDTFHQDLKDVWQPGWNCIARSEDVHSWGAEALHGTGVAGVFHQLSPLGSIVPIVKSHTSSYIIREALEVAARKSSILTLPFSLSKGYMGAEIEEEIKETVISIANRGENILFLASGNGSFDLEGSHYAKGLGEIVEATQENLILVGGTIEKEDKEYLWATEENFGPCKDDGSFTFNLGSMWPGSHRKFQKRFLMAPLKHYTTRAFVGDFLFHSKEKRFFNMVSSAVGVAAGIGERVWSTYPHLNGVEVGKALLKGASISPFEENTFDPVFLGAGMVHYEGSIKILEKMLLEK